MAPRLPLLLALACAGSSAASAQLQFQMTTPFPGNIWTNGIEIQDFDGDGNKDVVFANGSSYGGTGPNSGSQQQQLFMGNGDGTFTAAHSNLNIPSIDGMMVIAEDFDKDDDLDLFFCVDNSAQPPRLLMNDGNGVFSDETLLRLPPLTSLRSFGLAAGDVDNDEDLDVVILDGGTFGGQQVQHLLLENDGSGVFTDVTASNLPSDLYNAQDVTLFDFDMDFDIDIALSGKGANGKRGRLWINDGTGNFTVDSAMNQLGSGATYEVEWADLDGDGDLDALTQSYSGFSEGVGQNLGPGVTMPEKSLPNPNGDDDNEMGGLDYDNDGDIDVFVGSLGQREKLYRNNGNGTFTNQNAVIQAQADSTMDIQFGDLNNDGKYDMVTGQGESGNYTNRLYLSNASGPVDTVAPTLLNVESPAIGVGETIFRISTQDAIQDDGKTNLTADFAWVRNDGTGGSGTGFHQGGGTFRAAVSTPGGTTGVTLIWCVSDENGNQSTTTVTLGTGGGGFFVDLGNALAGAAGTPTLTGSGAALGGGSVSVDVANAASNSGGATILGVSQLDLPVLGGVLVPSLDVLFALSTDDAGSGSLTLPWPKGLPGGTTVYFQSWIVDASGPQGFAATNGMSATQP